MINNGLAGASKGTTSAPTMYEEIEQGDEVARGHVQVVELIAYDFVRREFVKDEFGSITDKQRVVEKGRAPYFCQTKEQEVIFKENNPDARIETFTIQLLKSTAIKYLDALRNVRQFTRCISPPTDDQVFQRRKKESVDAFNIASKGETLENPELTWRKQAKALGIPMFQRSKEEVLADIAKQTTTSTS